MSIGKRLDYRFIYLMKRESEPFLIRIAKYLIALFSGDKRKIRVTWKKLTRGQYKIGIAKNVQTRRRDIDRDLPRGIKVVFKIKVYFAERNEKRIQNRYKKKGDGYEPKNAGRAAGKTEHFLLKSIDAQLIKIELVALWLTQALSVCVMIVLIFCLIDPSLSDQIVYLVKNIRWPEELDGVVGS